MTQVVVVRWDAEKLLKRVPEVLTRYGEKVSPMLQESIKSRVYPWPSPTRRQVGRFSGPFVPAGPRDIVDTGRLLDSQTAPVITPNSLTIKWTAPYSKEVLTRDFVTFTGAIAQPRDWITPVIKAKPPLEFFAAEWRRIGGG